ncbi:regulator of chromosome condensation 1/beta-lactamase-inhibitor protein II [Tribonema minus]|uniref:Regulator of chromosome condensation 1/beta-lactamase-inhibitor protein II n=1 Tax=Tribonema minus TaxID=303371 RepID=A0A835Z9L6_9STRA|nr:regulator of chromosome condensation 1/beta-lactamase-inhibitor protein II [Tribonema minus]
MALSQTPSPLQGGAAHMHAIACLATETLRALEHARGKHAAGPAPATSLALLELLQLCLRHAAPAPPRDAPPLQVPAGVAAAAPDLERCVLYLKELLLKLLDEELNHFGTFKPSAFVAAVALLQDELAVTLQRASQPPPSENRDLSLDPTAMAMRCFVARAWWRRAFGEPSAAAAAAPTQAQFRDAFVRCYGTQPAPALNLFLQALCDTEQQATTGKGNAQRSSSSSARVSMHRFDALTHEHAGVYEAYQAVSDPGRLVYVMGVVGDDAHAVQSTPIVVTGLLGLKVSQSAAVEGVALVHLALSASASGTVCECECHFADDDACSPVAYLSFVTIHDYSEKHAAYRCLVRPIRGSCERSCRLPLVSLYRVARACRITELDDYLCTAKALRQEAMGAGENGRLGHGSAQDKLLPTEVEALHGRVQLVYAGSVHTCVLTTVGSVYSFGKFEYTGHGATRDVLSPQLVGAFNGMPVKSISVGPGGYHTIALTQAGTVYTWGHNRVGQLGYGNSEVAPKNVEGAFFQPLPQEVTTLRDKGVVAVVAGWGHSAALTASGQLYICGRNYKGQLGLGDPVLFQQNERGHHYQAHFQQLEDLSYERVTQAVLCYAAHTSQISCGGEHSAVITQGGSTIYSFGAGHKGQLGHGNCMNEYRPRRVEALMSTHRTLLHVACGNNCTCSGLPNFERDCVTSTMADRSQRYRSSSIMSPASTLPCEQPALSTQAPLSWAV